MSENTTPIKRPLKIDQITKSSLERAVELICKRKGCKPGKLLDETIRVYRDSYNLDGYREDKLYRPALFFAAGEDPLLYSDAVTEFRSRKAWLTTKKHWEKKRRLREKLAVAKRSNGTRRRTRQKRQPPLIGV